METTKSNDSGLKTHWTLDHSHSEISFRVKHLMITNVKGTFKDFDVQVMTDGLQFENARIRFTMKTTSVDTGDENRDNHLRSADFFDSGNYPDSTFVAESFEPVDETDYVLKGDLTIRGITKPVKLDVEFGGIQKDPWGKVKAGFSLAGKISRKDFGLLWNVALESGGVLVGDEVRILGEIQLAADGESPEGI